MRQPVLPGATPAAVEDELDAAFAIALEYARGLADLAIPWTAAIDGVPSFGPAPVRMDGSFSDGIRVGFATPGFDA